MSVLDPYRDYLRMLEIAGIRSQSASSGPPYQEAGRVTMEHPWRSLGMRYRSSRSSFTVKLHDPQLDAQVNTSRPFRANDGPVWQGRGATTAFSAGAYARLGPASFSLRPVGYFSQNLSFDLWPQDVPVGRTRYGYPSGGIDFPRAMGSDPFLALEWGQSFARLDYKIVGAGISTENLWWGPAIRNPIIMSGNAGGFPHAFFETSRPIGIGIGKLGWQWIWGELHESDFYDRVDTNNLRFITGILVSYQPRWIPGLTLGGTRVFVEMMPDRLTLEDVLAVTDALFKISSRTHSETERSDRFDQIVSVFGRWVFAESGFELYAEYAHGDHSSTIRDFALEPEHAQGYTMGLQKVTDLSGDRLVRFFSELTNLKSNRSNIARQTPSASFFYTHSRVQQGYTHRGQILGAGIGPGSDSQSFGIDLLAPWGSLGMTAERVAHDADTYYERYDTHLNHMIELGIGFHGRYFFQDFELGGGIALQRYLNEYYLQGNDVTNVHLAASVRYLLGQAR